MTDLRGARSAVEAAAGLGGQPAAASVISACLAAQSSTHRRSRIARLFGVSPLSEISRKPYLAALCELRVADELAKLGPDWAILNGVPVGERGQVIDHLVIGPAGVFAIDIIHQDDSTVDVRGEELTVNGVGRPYLSYSRDVATDAAVNLTHATGLNVPVGGLLVFVSSQSVSVHDEPDDLGVVGPRTLLRWLSAKPVRLEPSEVAAIATAAAQPATWRSGRDARTTGFNAEAFDSLRIEVQRAWAARGFWSCALVGAAAVAAFQLFG